MFLFTFFFKSVESVHGKKVSLKAPFAGAVWALKNFLAQNIPAVGRHRFAASLFANPVLPPQSPSQRESESETGRKGRERQR